MGEVMTMKEIEKRFDKEWVLLENPVSTKRAVLKEGKVLWHSKNRDELYKKALEFRPVHSAIFFVGYPPDDMVLVL